MKITTKIDDKEVGLELTSLECQTGISICEINAISEVIVMKKHNGGALFFADQRAANACQERYNFDYSFTVKASDLKGGNQKKVSPKTNNKSIGNG